MNLASFLQKAAMIHGDRPALSVADRHYADYRAFARRVAGLASALREPLGARKGDRVALLMKNTPQYLEVLFAAWHAGLCVVPINARLHPKEIAYVLDNSGAHLCFATNDLAQAIDPSLEARDDRTVINVEDGEYELFAATESLPVAQVSPDDPAWLFYTSGTTGRPKGATLSHRNLLGMALRYFADIDALSCDDCYLHAAPLSHGGGLYSLPHVLKGTHQVFPASRGFDAGEVLDLAAQHKRATFFVAPTMLTRLTEHPRAASVPHDAIKTICYGGAPMYVSDLKRAIALFGPRLFQLFGQGESPMTGTGLDQSHHADVSHPRYEARLASVGVARTGVEVRIVDDRGHDLPVGECGEVLLRSDVTMLGYWNDPEASRTTVRDGWLHTGDIGAFDEDGFVTLKDRSKDMIISGGVNIYPREVEEVLLRDPRVREVSIVGRLHPEWGEEVVAFVVTRDGKTIDQAELDVLCLANIARFKRPRTYYFVDDLPKNNYGKILKRELKDRLAPLGSARSFGPETPDRASQ